jgi:hypothetical protein
MDHVCVCMLLTVRVYVCVYMCDTSYTCIYRGVFNRGNVCSESDFSGERELATVI